MPLAELTIEDAAEEAAGNWKDFDCFVWYREKEVLDAENWAIIYTHNRDSRLLDQSNAEVISEALRSFSDTGDPDVVIETHSHWLVGHVDGFSVRVFKDGEITPAFRQYYELVMSMADYPVLDESDYSEREYEATLENIPLAAWQLEKQYELPDDWVSQVYEWFSENDCTAIENTDDQGGWPTDEQLVEAFDSLGFVQVE